MRNLLDLVQQARADLAELQIGVATAKVIDNEDPDGLARVKLTYPWLGVENNSGWTRVTSPMAGNDRGYYALPEVGDEVLVAFEKGDLNHPYVLGVLWNVDDSPPEKNDDGKNNRRVFKSRSGHLLVFDDDSDGGKAKVEITTAAGHKINLDDASGGEKVEITTAAGHKINLDDASGGEKIEIVDKSGSNSIIIDSAGGSINLKASGKLVLEATEIEIKSSANCKVEAGGMLTIKGSLVQIN